MIHEPVDATIRHGPLESERCDFVRLMERPWPVHFIGDSHVLMFSDLLFDDPTYFKRRFITKARYCEGLAAARFVENEKINNAFTQALFGQGLLAATKEGQLIPSHLVHNQLADAVVVARGRSRVPPTIVVTCGDLDIRTLFLPKLTPTTDFTLEDDGTDTSKVPPWEATQFVPSQLIMDLADRLVRPLFQGLTYLKSMGFTELFLHCVVPQDVEAKGPIGPQVGMYPVGLRYKCIRLINSLYRQFCKESGIGFIDIWNDVTDGGLLDPHYYLDGVHLNKYGAERTMNELVWLMANYNYQRLRPSLPAWTKAYDEAHEAFEARSDRDEEAAEAFRKTRIMTIDLGRDFAQSILDEVEFSHGVGNRHLHPEWCGNPPFPTMQVMKAAEPSKAVLDRIYAKLYDPKIERTIASCMDANWTILVVRLFESLAVSPDEPEKNLHRDGGPPVILRGVVYLNDVDEDGGPFEYVNDKGEEVAITGPAGTMVLFDAEHFDHRGSWPRKRDRHNIDIVFSPRIKGDRPRVMFAGMNNWPYDPFYFGTEGFTISYGP